VQVKLDILKRERERQRALYFLLLFLLSKISAHIFFLSGGESINPFKSLDFSKESNKHSAYHLLRLSSEKNQILSIPCDFVLSSVILYLNTFDLKIHLFFSGNAKITYCIKDW